MSRKQLDQFLFNAFSSRELTRALVQVSNETMTRPVRPCRCVVAEVPETAKDDEFAGLTPGTVTAFVAEEGEPVLGRLKKAVREHNSKEFGAASEQIKLMEANVARQISTAMIYPASEPRRAPAFAQINYSGKTLISHIYVDETLRVNAHAFTYNGGHLDKNNFSMLEYYRADSDTPLSCLLVIRRPRLGEIEREALRLVPSELSANNISPSALRITPVAVAALVWVGEAVAAGVVGWAVGKALDRLFGLAALAALPDEVLESEDFRRKLNSLPPEATAAELLRLRTDILLRRPK